VANHETEFDRREPVPERTRLWVRYVGALRLPLAGPYRPWVRLYSGPDGTAWWTVRLWEVDRAAIRIVSTATLTAFARANRLLRFLAEVEALQARAEGGDGP
jgi:hypothetical protein